MTLAQARRADTTVVELLKEINTGNAAMKGATDDAGTGNVAVIKTVVDSLNQVVAEMKALVVAVKSPQPPGEAPCIPYTEWTDPKDKKCKLLSRPCDARAQWEKARPTRSSDRKCEKHSVCELGKTFEVVEPTGTSDRECKKVKACDAKTEGELAKPTLLSDRVCGTFGLTEASAQISCLKIKELSKNKAKSGWYVQRQRNHRESFPALRILLPRACVGFRSCSQRTPRTPNHPVVAGRGWREANTP